MVLTDTNVWLTDMAEILDLYQRGWLGEMNGHFQPQGIKALNGFNPSDVKIVDVA